MLSANYGLETETAHPSVGGTFLMVDGSETYPLSNITVDADDVYEAFDPDTEFIQVLNEGDTSVDACYTYISKLYCDLYGEIIGKEAGEALEEYIGWWDFDLEDGMTVDKVMSGDLENRDNEPIKVGSAFLGAFSELYRKFTSSGEVAMDVTYIESELAHPYFVNYLPVAKNLGRFTIDASDVYEAFDPDTEFVQVLNKDDTSVDACYTFISKLYCDLYGEIIGKEAGEALEAYIGWWDFDLEDGMTVDKVLSGDLENRDDIIFYPGDAFLGAFSELYRKINFPGAVEKDAE